MNMTFSRLALGALLLAGGVGCSRSERAQPAAQTPTPASEHHAHVAPHGGTLVAIGEHQFNVEFVRDADAGRLTAYILDAHADEFVRLPIRGFAVVCTVEGRRESLPMAAVSNTVTGETVGDTSEFAATADWLKTAAVFSARIPALDIRGITFTDVSFTFPTGP